MNITITILKLCFNSICEVVDHNNLNPTYPLCDNYTNKSDIHPVSQQENYYATFSLINDNPNVLKLAFESADYKPGRR
jgi:hypothetical protein